MPGACFSVLTAMLITLITLMTLIVPRLFPFPTICFPHRYWPLVSVILAMLVDLIGVCTFAIPVVGEFADALWAPISAMCISYLFNDPLATRIGFFEELLPGTDMIPTACLAWLRQNWRFVPVWLNLIQDKPASK